MEPPHGAPNVVPPLVPVQRASLTAPWPSWQFADLDKDGNEILCARAQAHGGVYLSKRPMCEV